MAGFDLSDVLAAARGIPGARGDGRWRCIVYLSAYDWMSGWLRASDMAAQSAACKAWLSAHGDARKVETIRNRNAVRNVRAAFDELMRVIENRRADCVVVPDIAVFAPCFSEARFYVEEVLMPMGFRFVDCARGFDTQGGDVRAYFKGLQTEMSNALALHAEHDRLASGGLIRRNVPFGYVFDEDAPCGVRVDGEVAAFVPRIFELAAQGRWWRSKLEGQVCVSSSRFEQMGNFSLTVSGRSRWRSPAGGRPPAAHATPTAGRGTCRCGSAAPWGRTASGPRWGRSPRPGTTRPWSRRWASSRRSACTFESREQAALEIVEYIECLYDRVRTHSALGYLSPEEFEARNRKGAAKAA